MKPHYSRISFILLILSLQAPAAPVPAPNTSSLSSTNPSALNLQWSSKKTELSRAIHDDGTTLWIDLGLILQTINTPWTWDPHSRQIALSPARIARLTLEIPIATVDDSILPLNRAPALRKGSVWLSLPDAQKFLGKTLDMEIIYAPETRTLRFQPAKDILYAKLDSRQNGDLLELKLSRRLRYESFFHPPHFILRLENATLDSSLFRNLKGNLVKKILPIQEKQSAQITVQVHNGSEGGEILERDSGTVLQILFRKPQPGDTTSPTPPTKITKKLSTIIIDPGHGGKDPGALGLKSQEKDIVLAVGQKLRDKLRKAGFQVYMTREDDTFVELQERPAMASRWGGDLFISLHCNAVEGNTEKKNKTDGFRIYILREAESEEDKAIERRENQAALLSSKKTKAEISPVEWILLENQLNLYTKESETFAANLVESMTQSKINKQGSGAGQAGFMVLVGAFMPAVLVELGFITNPKDEEYMMSQAGQETLADCILKAVLQYRDLVERRHNN